MAMVSGQNWLAGAIVGAMLLGSGQHAQAAFITVSASGTYTELGGNNDTAGDAFTIVNTSPAGIQIAGIAIFLPSNTLFDTVNAGSGQNPGRPYANVVAPAGGTATLNPGPTVTDGTTLIAVEFTGFDATDTFSFTIDVDDTVGGNANARRNVPGAEFAGATVAVTFSGAFLGSPQTFSGSYFADFLSEVNANVRVSGQVEVEEQAVPVPPGLLLIGLGSLALTGYSYRRRPVP